jgi:hypothetical protein
MRSLAATVGVIAVGASASGTLPLSPTVVPASAVNNGLQVRPATITYTGDGTGYLGGANRNSSIHWTKWTTHIAVGTGFNQLNNCIPSCAGGKFHGYRVKIELWRPRTVGGRFVFTRLTIFYKLSRPAGEPRHYTFTDIHVRGAGGGYSWGPPAEQDYCVNTFGLKPAPGCKNIHSLP